MPYHTTDCFSRYLYVVCQQLDVNQPYDPEFSSGEELPADLTAFLLYARTRGRTPHRRRSATSVNSEVAATLACCMVLTSDWSISLEVALEIMEKYSCPETANLVVNWLVFEKDWGGWEGQIVNSILEREVSWHPVSPLFFASDFVLSRLLFSCCCCVHWKTRLFLSSLVLITYPILDLLEF